MDGLGTDLVTGHQGTALTGSASLKCRAGLDPVLVRFPPSLSPQHNWHTHSVHHLQRAKRQKIDFALANQVGSPSINTQGALQADSRGPSAKQSSGSSLILCCVWSFGALLHAKVGGGRAVAVDMYAPCRNWTECVTLCTSAYPLAATGRVDRPCPAQGGGARRPRSGLNELPVCSLLRSVCSAGCGRRRRCATNHGMMWNGTTPAESTQRFKCTALLAQTKTRYHCSLRLHPKAGDEGGVAARRRHWRCETPSMHAILRDISREISMGCTVHRTNTTMLGARTGQLAVHNRKFPPPRVCGLRFWEFERPLADPSTDRSGSSHRLWLPLRRDPA